jgi:hypothetical protein
LPEEFYGAGIPSLGPIRRLWSMVARSSGSSCRWAFDLPRASSS